jgi:signal transduction histidine kinase/ActR/RegA family two-component response regulator
MIRRRATPAAGEIEASAVRASPGRLLQGRLGRARRSVRGKLMSVIFVTTATALVLAGVAMMLRDLTVYRHDWDNEIQGEAQIIALATAPALAFDDHNLATRNLGALRANRAVLAAGLYQASGSLYAEYVRPGEAPPPARIAVPHRDRVRVSGQYLELAHPIVREGQSLGTVYLRARYDLMSRLWGYAEISGVVSLLSLAVALVLSSSLQRGITRPLGAIAEVARQVARRKDYSLRVSETPSDEIGLLVEAFNGMLDEVQSRTEALVHSNAALQEEVKVRKAAEAERSQANARLEATMDALRRADRRKDEFLATLAHELRNPLAPIRNAVKLLELPAADERRRQWGRDVIARQVQRMALLLDDLLDVSRITRGRLELKKDYISLASLVASAIETARPMIDAKRHILQTVLPEEPIELLVDPLRLSQALSNLLTNAAKYSDPGGRITFTAALDEAELTFSVRDTGIGLSAANIAEVFEMFSQVDSAIDRSEGGLGIGLALVKGLIALHGGTVEAQSPGIGQGSTFSIRLPAAAVLHHGGRSDAQLSMRPAVVADPRCSVLIADDNRDAADSLALLLQMSGYELHVCHSGREALALAQRERPHALVLDIGMPGMNGYELARHIRQEAWGREVLLVAVTGWGQQEDRERSRAAGFDHHLTKPVDPDTLQALLADYARGLTGRPSLSPKANH